MLAQAGEHEFYVSFFETPPPVIITPEDVNKLEGVRAECIARIVIAADRMAEFVKVLGRQLDTYNEKKKAAGAKSNGAK